MSRCVDHRSDEQGNVLVLVPAVMLIVILLASLAIDTAALHLGQRRLADLAGAIANDVVAAADLDAYYTSGEIVPDPDRVAARRGALERSAADGGLEWISCDVVVDAPAVTVSCRAVTRPVMAAARPGRSAVEIRAVETVLARR